MKSKPVPNTRIRALLVAGLFGVALSGCGKDAALTAKVKNLASSSSATQPASDFSLRTGTGVDVDSVGGDDDVQPHETSSGSFSVSKVSISSNYQRMEASGGSFVVTGGIYVQ